MARRCPVPFHHGNRGPSGPRSTRRLQRRTSATARPTWSASRPRPPIPCPRDFRKSPVLDRPGWRLLGYVRNTRGIPVAGARIRVHREPEDTDQLSPCLAETRTDEAGRYALALAAPEDARRSEDGTLSAEELFLRAQAPLHCPEGEYLDDLPLPSPLLPLVREDFFLSPRGYTVCGTMVDAHGRPVVDASLLRLGDENRWEEEDCTDWDGCFSMALPGDRGQWLLACAPGRGVAGPRYVEVPHAGGLDLGEWALEPFGVIAGRLVLPDGSPVRDAEVQAFPGSLAGATEEELSEFVDLLYPTGHDMRPGPFTRRFAPHATWEERKLELSSGFPLDGPMEGFPYGSVQTEPDGRFRIEGLVPGSYFLWSDGENCLAEDLEEPVPRTPCRTGDLDVTVTLPFYWVEIRVRDARGRVPEDAIIDFRSDHHIAHHYGIRNGEARLEVTPGKVNISAFGPDGAWDEREFEVKPGDYLTTCTLELKPQSRGTIRFDLTLEEGYRLKDPGGLVFHFQGDVNRKSSRSAARCEVSADDGFRCALPMDHYKIFVLPDPEMEFLCPAYVKTWVLPEEESRVEMTLVKGGRLELEVSQVGPGGEGEWLLGIERFEKTERTKNSKWNDFGHFPRGEADAYAWTPGYLATSPPIPNVFPPGRYRVKDRGEWRVKSPAEFVIERCRVTRLRVEVEWGKIVSDTIYSRTRINGVRHYFSHTSSSTANMPGSKSFTSARTKGYMSFVPK